MAPRVVMLLAAPLIVAAGSYWLGRLTLGGALWAAGFTLMSAVRVPAIIDRFKAKTRSVDSSQRDRIAVLCFGVGLFFIPCAWLLLPVFAFADYAPPLAQTVLGGAAALLSALLCWRAHADLKRQWSSGLEIIEGHSLVTTGIYARIRHPMYTAFALGALSQVLLLDNWLAGAAGPVGVALMLLLRLPREEAMLAKEFGDAWTEYTTRAGAFWPGRGAERN